MREISDKNWLCPKCGGELNYTSCDKCKRDWYIDKRLSSICPVCFSNCIFQNGCQICSNWDCASWDIREGKSTLILTSNIDPKFNDMIILNRDFNTHGVPIGYFHSFLEFPFLYNLINAIWYSKRKIDVRSIPAITTGSYNLSIQKFGL